MNLLVKLFFGGIIKKEVDKRVREHITERVSAHEKVISKAHIDTKVMLVSDDIEAQFTEMLGINDKRKNKITDAVRDACKDSRTFPEAMEKVSTMTVHPNELAFGCFVVGTFAQSQNSSMMGMMGPLLDMLRKRGRMDNDDNGSSF